MIKSTRRIILFVLFLLTWFWGAGTIFYGPWPLAVRVAVGVFWALVAWEFFRPSNERQWTRYLVAFVMISILWAFHRPSGAGNWALDQQRVPRATFDGDIVRIENVRNATYHSADHFEVTWEAHEYDLTTLDSVDFVLEPFAMNGHLAHTFLTFGFTDGRHVAISAEIRKQSGDRFSPLRGIFKQFELMYVIADERDLIGLRANVREHPVRLYPCVATKDQARALFVAMLGRANALAKQPEFYHSVRNTCTSNITWHLEQLGWQDWRLDRRLIFPGRADEVGYERGLLDVEGSMDEIRDQCLINGRCAFGANSIEWSRQIRDK